MSQLVFQPQHMDPEEFVLSMRRGSKKVFAMTSVFVNAMKTLYATKNLKVTGFAVPGNLTHRRVYQIVAANPSLFPTAPGLGQKMPAALRG